MRRIYLTLIFLLSLSGTILGQRFTDKLDRGLVAVPVSGGTLVSWRVMGEEYYDVVYNLYRDGTKIASNLRVSNYLDAAGKSSSKYQVAPVVRGVEGEKCAEVTRWANQYKDIKVATVVDRNGNNVNDNYTLNDVTLADVNGDGVAEMIVKRPCGIAADVTNKTAFHLLDCYDVKGNRLWWIDMGPNMLAGADEQWDCVGYDWDCDGKAEILLRGADNMIIHHPDGSTTKIGSDADTRWSGIEYTNSGNEYLLYLEGATAKPYQIGDSSHPNYMTYPNPRGSADDWGDGYGHRSTKHFFGAPFLDGRKASIFLGRGVYTKILCKAFDVDPETHKLTQRWAWECTNGSSPWYGQGYHNYSIADVDWDGRDEIVYGSMVIDDNGKGLSTTGLGHGDAHHVQDFNPYVHGQEIFACNESSPAMNYRNATTSEFYYRYVGGSDDGRALCGNFSNSYPGCVGRSVGTGMISTVANKVVSELDGWIDWSDLNNRIYWDDDLLDEVLNSPGTEREAKIDKPGQGRIFTSSGCKMNNWTKNNPGAQADLYGDWREEIVLRTGDNAYLRIYVTPYETKYRNYTLWHDHQYRQAMVWQTLGYNQPPHVSYFLGEMEGITVAPPPLTMTGRTEVANGGTIDSNLNDKHVIVCETNNTDISIQDGAAPYIITFNVPSWVQGSGGNNATTKSPTIKYTYYECNVTGGALSGEARIVKQGDGILNLPNAVNTNTGNTDIWAGTVNFDGTMQNSRVWLNRLTTMNTSGTFGKSIEMDYGAQLLPGGANNKRDVVIADSLILNFGAKVVFDVYGSDFSSDCIKTGAVKVGTKNWKYGPEYLTPVFEIVPHYAEGNTKLEIGQYKLMEAQTIVGNLSDIVIKGISGQKAYLSEENGAIYLNVEGIRDASTVYWTGANDKTWDFAMTENFMNAEGDADIFVENDKVIFNDEAKNFTVTLNGELPADSIIVENSKAYTFSGNGKITGNSMLVKKGTGKLTISTDNTYTGGTHILGGTVAVSSLSNATQAYGNLGGVVTSNAKFTIENGAVLQTTAAVTNNSPIKLVGDEGGVIINSADFIMNKSFAGTMLTKKGNGWMKLYSENASLNTLVVAAGTVDANVASPAKTVDIQGGTLNLNATSSVNINVPEGKSGAVYCTADRGTYTNKLTGKGTVTISYPLVKGSGWNATRAAFNGNWSAFEGTVKVASTDNEQYCLNNSYGIPKGTLNIPSGYYVTTTGKTFKIGKVTGTGNLAGTGALSNNGTSGTTTWQVGNDDTNFSFEGKVTSNPTFQKVGACKMTVKGAWETSGTVAVNGGDLHLSSGSMLGTGVLTIGKDGLLSGTTSSSVSLTNSKVTVNGTVQAGTLASSLSGFISFGGKDVTFNAGSKLQLGAGKCATASANGCSSLKGIGTLTINGCIEIYVGSSTKLEVGDSIRLWTDVTTFKGNPTFSFPAGYEFDTSRIAEGLLFVTLCDGIGNIYGTDRLNDNKSYDLSGRQVDENAKGIIIRNGKKQLVK